MKFKILNFKFKIIALFLFSYLAIFLFSHSHNVYADSPLSLTISPPILEVLVKPGKNISQKIILRNLGESVAVVPKILEYSSRGIDPDSVFEAESWIEIKTEGVSQDKPFELPGASQKEILLDIHPPEGTIEAEYNRVFLFTTVPSVAKDQSESLISESIGSVLLLTVSKTGNIVRSAKITDFKLPLIHDSLSALTSDIYLSNSGQGIIRPTGKISIASPFLNASYSINTLTIFPGERKMLKTDLTSKSAHESHTLFLSGFYLGKYDIQVSVSIGSNISKIIQTRTFYAIPWKLLLLLGVLITVLLLIKKTRKTNKITLPQPLS